MRKALERWSDRLSGWNEFFTAIVVGGLVIEYLPGITYFFPRSFSTLVRPHTEQLREFGGLLVIVGVAGELWTDARASRVETDLREENNSAIAAAQERVAELQERTAKAEKDAAEANLARLKLEHRYAARRISGQTYEALREVLPRYTGKRVDIFLFDTHVTEVDMLGRTLHVIFLNCGWDSRLWISRGDKMSDIGFTLGIASEVAMTEEDPQPIAHELVPILKLGNSNIATCVSVGGFSKLAPVSVTGDQEWNPKDVASLRIEIGEKSVVSTLDLFAAHTAAAYTGAADEAKDSAK